MKRFDKFAGSEFGRAKRSEVRPAGVSHRMWRINPLARNWLPSKPLPEGPKTGCFRTILSRPSPLPTPLYNHKQKPTIIPTPLEFPPVTFYSMLTLTHE